MGIDRPPNRKAFLNWVFEVDRILRGDATNPDQLQQADIKIPVLGISLVIILLAVVYGFCMGIFALVHGFEHNEFARALLQTFASMCKVPLLFALTLLVTFPSLYVFNALVGSQLRVLPVLKLLVASLAVNLAVLASMGPILAFFSVSTPNYSFIVLLNVVVFSVAGMLGLSFLIQTLNRLTLANRQTHHSTSATSGTAIPGSGIGLKAVTRIQSEAVDSAEPAVNRSPLDHPAGAHFNHHVRRVFACWIVVFGLVGAQMGWVLRPFIGSPNQPFHWFRARNSNFFESVWNSLHNLFF